MKKMRKFPKLPKLPKMLHLIPLVFLALAVGTNILARIDRQSAGGMRRFIFQTIEQIQGRISGIFPFSIGEFMIIAGLLLLIIWALLIILGLFNFISSPFFKRKEKHLSEEELEKSLTPRAKKQRRFIRKFSIFMGWLICFEVLTMTINCFNLYHASAFGDVYLPAGRERYTIGQLATLREYVISQANAMAEDFPRDENGYLLIQRTNDELEEQSVRDMEKLGEKYDNLEGYYSEPKPILFSGFLSQQYVAGYYFPFSMEANYNTRMYVANMPFTMCHELSHLKGYIREDDANMIGYLACVGSDDEFSRYCGYLNVINYLSNDLYESLGENRQLYAQYIQCSDKVKQDNIFLTEEAWVEVEEHAIFDTEKVREVANTFLDKNLTLNGVEEGTASYQHVVELLLRYYDGILY